MPYSSYDHDKLEAAETMRIERRIYFEAKDREIAPYASLPIAQLLSMRSESAAAEQAIFDDLKERAAAWEEQAGRTLLLDKTLEYVRTPHVQHTANEWQTTEHNRHIRSNRVYQMNYPPYSQQPGISDELPHLRKHPLRQGEAAKRPLLLFSHMGRLYQQPEQERASEDCRTR